MRVSRSRNVSRTTLFVSEFIVGASFRGLKSFADILEVAFCSFEHVFHRSAVDRTDNRLCGGWIKQLIGSAEGG